MFDDLADRIARPMQHAMAVLARHMTPDQMRLAARDLRNDEDQDPMNRAFYGMIAKGLDVLADEVTRAN